MYRRLLLIVLVLLIGTVHAQENETYTVRVGDSLREIAETFDVNLDCLMDSNGIANPSFITPGQELIIPAACPPFVTDADAETEDSETGTMVLPPDESLPGDEEVVTETDDDDQEVEDAETAEDVASLGQGGGIATDSELLDDDGYYTVQFGETLGRIAIRFDTTVACLIQSNNIADPDLIFTGQRLFISETCEPDGQGGGGFADTDTSTTTLDLDRICRGDRNAGRTTSNGVYVVQAGDMLDFIGCDFGLQTECLSEVNNLNPPGSIDIGQSLIIDFTCPPWDGPPGPGDLDN